MVIVLRGRGKVVFGHGYVMLTVAEGLYSIAMVVHRTATLYNVAVWPSNDLQRQEKGEMVMSLFEINKQILNCVVEGDHAVDTETGEVIDLTALEQLKMDAHEKTENIALWVKNLAAEKDAVKKQKEVFAQREKALTNKIDSLKGYLSLCLGGKKFTTDKVVVSFRNSEAVKVVDENKVPGEYLIPVEPKVDKTSIKKAIKGGREVPGVELEKRTSVVIK